MSGLGWKKFQAGEVLTANNFQSYAVDQSVQYYASSAARTTALGTAVTEGMVSYLADVNDIQVYDGAAWQSVYPPSASDIVAGTLAIARGGTGFTTGAGLIPVIPTSVNVASGTGTYNATTGLVTFTGATSVAVNGCFTSAFRNYRILFDESAATAYADGNMRLRVGGVDAAGTSYYRNGILCDAAAVSGFSNNADQWYGNVLTTVNIASNAYAQAAIEVHEPFLAKPTTVQSINHAWSGTIQRFLIMSGFNTNATSYDGFTILLNTGNFSGTFKIYGYN